MSGFFQSVTSLGFGTPPWAWLFALAVPLVVFYFLKLRRPRTAVPSLALWRRVVNDKRVNSPFQKFRRNLLLLLQLLLLAALVLAAMQPFVRAGAGSDDYLPVLIDVSASTAARAEAGGPTRLDVAKAEAAALIDDLRPGRQVALIAFGDTAQKIADFTDNRRLLRAALDGLEPRQTKSDLGEALRITQALSRSYPIAEAVLLSDGNVPPETDFELSFPVNFQKLPAAGPNVGITSLNARRGGGVGAGGDVWDVFVRVAGTPGHTATADLVLTRVGETAPLATETVTVDGTAGEDGTEPGARVVFEVTGGPAVPLEVRLVPAGFDALDADDRAFLDLPPTRPPAVFCPEPLALFRRALAADESLALFPTPSGDTGPATYDFAVIGGEDAVGGEAAADEAPAANVRLFVGRVPEELRELISMEVGLAEVVDWQRTAPALEHVQLRDVQITDEPAYAPGAGVADLEQLGYEVLVDARTGPLLLRRREGRTVDYHLLFAPERSTLPYRVAFPILVQNLVREAVRAADLSEVRAAATGVLPPRPAPADASVTVRGPDGRTRTVLAGPDGVLTGVPAPRVGRYELSAGGEPLGSVGVGLLAESETSLRTVGELKFREVAVQASAEKVDRDRPLWTWLAWAALFLLLAEWWVFHRRVGVGV